MTNPNSINKFNKNNFWNGFFFVLGFRSNPFLTKAKEIKKKSVNDRIGDSLEATSVLFNEVYLHETACLND